jgi:hypothetical protein
MPLALAEASRRCLYVDPGGRATMDISIATIERDQVVHKAAVAVDWVDHISGDTDWARIEPAPPLTWDDLAAEVRTVPHRLAGKRRILVSGTYAASHRVLGWLRAAARDGFRSRSPPRCSTLGPAKNL